MLTRIKLWLYNHILEIALAVDLISIAVLLIGAQLM